MKYYFYLNNNCIIQVTNYTWLSYVFLYFTKGSGGGGQKRNLNMRADPEKFSKKEDPKGYLFAGVSETYFP